MFFKQTVKNVVKGGKYNKIFKKERAISELFIAH